MRRLEVLSRGALLGAGGLLLLSGCNALIGLEDVPPDAGLDTGTQPDGGAKQKDATADAAKDGTTDGTVHPDADARGGDAPATKETGPGDVTAKDSAATDASHEEAAADAGRDAKDAAIPNDAACGDGGTECGGACVDERSDLANCGGCGNACALPHASLQECASGKCVAKGCLANFALCSGACTDVFTDPNNCGGCGTTCSGGTSCIAGNCQVIDTLAVSGQPFAIAADSTNVYWTQQKTSAAVNRCPLPSLAACTPTVVSGPSETAPPYFIASDGVNAYWTDDVSATGEVRFLPTSSAPHTVPSNYAPYNGPLRIVWDGDSTYPSMFFGETGGVVQVAMNGGAMVAGTVTSPGGGQVTGVAAYNGSVYWASPGKATIYTAVVPCHAKDQFCDATVPTASTFQAGQTNPLGVAASSLGVFWVNGESVAGKGDGSVVGITSGVAGGFVTIATGGNPTSIVADATGVYWIDPAVGGVFRAVGVSNPGGGRTSTLATGDTGVSDLAIDPSPGTGLYWAVATPGKIRHLPKR